jgi:hypothetical protein
MVGGLTSSLELPWSDVFPEDRSGPRGCSPSPPSFIIAFGPLVPSGRPRLGTADRKPESSLDLTKKHGRK